MPRAKSAAAATPVRSRKPVVAIVGRPNVGKSTLFNRLVGQRQAITEDIPGTTRDRLYAEAEWKDLRYTLIDTGGLEPDSDEGYPALIRDQVQIALAEADVILFVVDATSGVTPVDAEIGEMLRRTEKPVLLLANKGDNPAAPGARRRVLRARPRRPDAGQRLPRPRRPRGAGQAARDAARDAAPKRTTDTCAIARRRPARTSASPRSINAILGEERVIESEMAGTTRDAVDTPFEYKGHQMVLVDTAGIRRPGKVEKGIEKYSVMRARERHRARRRRVARPRRHREASPQQDLHIAGMSPTRTKA